MDIGKSDASFLCLVRHNFFFFFIFLSLHHPSNYVGNISIFLCSIVQLGSQKKVFLGRKNIEGTFSRLHLPPNYADGLDDSQEAGYLSELSDWTSGWTTWKSEFDFQKEQRCSPQASCPIGTKFLTGVKAVGAWTLVPHDHLVVICMWVNIYQHSTVHLGGMVYKPFV